MLQKIVFIVVLITSILLLDAYTERASAQSSYIDLTIVESTDYNKPVATFSRESFEDVFRISSPSGDQSDPDINKALVLFLNILVEGHSYIIQHEPTYYFVFQFNKKTNNYLVMNNSIGEKNEAIYVNSFKEAQKEMFNLLQVFYSNAPVLSVQEYR